MEEENNIYSKLIHKIYMNNKLKDEEIIQLVNIIHKDVSEKIRDLETKRIEKRGPIKVIIGIPSKEISIVTKYIYNAFNKVLTDMTNQSCIELIDKYRIFKMYYILNKNNDNTDETVNLMNEEIKKSKKFN